VRATRETRRTERRMGAVMEDLLHGASHDLDVGG